MTVWTATLAGRPTTKGNSSRILSMGKGPTARRFIAPSKAAVVGEAALRDQLLICGPSEMLKGALILDAFFCFKIPKSAKGTCPGDACLRHVDRGNLLKLLEDAMKGIVYEDDSQITGGFVAKLWWTRDATLVRVREAPVDWLPPVPSSPLGDKGWKP